MVNRVKERLTRSVNSDLKTRAEQEDMIIEGYFAVFNRETELWSGAFEAIDSEAFKGTLGNDIRALINHDTSLVLGRNKANTLELKTDSHGLWGSIRINPNDMDAVNLYERVKRGDVDQCSFGFNVFLIDTLDINLSSLVGNPMNAFGFATKAGKFLPSTKESLTSFSFNTPA